MLLKIFYSIYTVAEEVIPNLHFLISENSIHCIMMSVSCHVISY